MNEEKQKREAEKERQRLRGLKQREKDGKEMTVSGYDTLPLQNELTTAAQ